ncbi:MAG: LacI family DNA-binding transcriptional regulator [Ilumatobacteraceae bacterium]
MSGHAVTLADVAVEAGVHPSTVSRVISRPQLIGAPTRTAVQAAVARLGYIPNKAARQLAGGRVGSLGVLVPDITNPFFAQVVRSLQRCCRSAGLTMLLADTDQRADEELSEARALTGSVDGFVVCSSVAGTQHWRHVVGATPLVFVNRRAKGVASVTLDQHAIVELGVAHLRSLGHRRIGVVRGPDAYWSARERHRAVGGLDGIVALGPTRPDFEAGIALTDELIASEVTGVLAFNDLQALGIMAGCRAAGKSVPGDLSVVGSDDIGAGAMSDPPLTTVTAPVQQLGAAALQLIEQLIAGSVGETEVSLPVTLNVRSSTRRRAK